MTTALSPTRVEENLTLDQVFIDSDSRMVIVGSMPTATASLAITDASVGPLRVGPPERTTRSAPWRSIVFLASLTRHL
jgi:hypothetical protein